jgi:hypothetical protein
MPVFGFVLGLFLTHIKMGWNLRNPLITNKNTGHYLSRIGGFVWQKCMYTPSLPLYVAIYPPRFPRRPAPENFRGSPHCALVAKKSGERDCIAFFLAPSGPSGGAESSRRDLATSPVAKDSGEGGPHIRADRRPPIADCLSAHFKEHLCKSLSHVR